MLSAKVELEKALRRFKDIVSFLRRSIMEAVFTPALARGSCLCSDVCVYQSHAFVIHPNDLQGK